MQIVYELELDPRLKTLDLLCLVLDEIENAYQEVKDRGSDVFKKWQAANRDWIEFHRIGKVWEHQLMKGGNK
jgi:hypothetical protein